MPKDTLTSSPSPSERGEQNKKSLSFLKQAEGESLQMEKEIFYRATASAAMIQIARDLRQRETSSEEYLWQAIRNRRLNNLKFRRQHPIANTAFVVDFLCYEARLVIELDGKIHQIQQQEDEYRHLPLKAKVISFCASQMSK